MKRLSLRVRLALAFATGMALVLAAMGFFVYVRVGDALASSVDQSLKAQAAETTAHLRRSGELADPDFRLVDEDTAGGPVVAEVLEARGRVVRSTPLRLPALIRPDALEQVRRGRRLLWTRPVPGREHEWRVLATPLESPSGELVLVVGRSLESRTETLDRLFTELAIAGPIALLLSSLAGYGLASAALRPVESMRRRAQAISASTPGRRLPVPEGRDEIVRLATTLNDMLGRLEAAFEHERRFVADASHELRTPLALLRTELEVALRRPRPREELEAALRSAAEEAERLSQLAEDLLLIARADQGRLPVRRERVSADQLLDDVARRFRARAREAGRVIVVAPADGVALDADPYRLAQALANLVDNALTHGRGTVELSAHGRDGLVELHVTDEGAGFPPGFAERAFDRFSRADEARAGGGTGLGLSIVSLIAEAHDGEVGLGDAASGGADVWIAVAQART